MYYFTDELFLQHDTGRGHPENPARLDAILDRLHKQSWFNELQMLPRRFASQKELLSNHSAVHLENLAKTCQGTGGAFNADTIVSPESFDAAYLAAGAGLAASDAVMAADTAKSKKALLLVRPPGHHATRDQAMGFCLLNNIAICAHYLKTLGLRRIAILDWDVHHGNGTEESFYKDASVLYISIHQQPCYPGTGLIEDIGQGAGEGFNLNVPMDPGSRDIDYQSAIADQVLPRLQEFLPEILLLSAGFDAHIKDPLANQQLTSGFYEWVTRQVAQATQHSTMGRSISFLEGGYHHEALAESVELHAAALLNT